MITGAHAIVYSSAADDARAFLRDVLGLSSVDAGGGWLVFALPPAELAIHPTDSGGKQEVYLTCDDVEATAKELAEKGVDVGPISDEGWGLLTSFTIPGGVEMGLYEARHPLAHG